MHRRNGGGKDWCVFDRVCGCIFARVHRGDEETGHYQYLSCVNDGRSVFTSLEEIPLFVKHFWSFPESGWPARMVAHRKPGPWRPGVALPTLSSSSSSSSSSSTPFDGGDATSDGGNSSQVTDRNPDLDVADNTPRTNNKLSSVQIPPFKPHTR
jgi:hypothetical protein